MDKIPLNLSSGSTDSPGSADPTATAAATQEKQPVMGWCAVAFGLLGIFTIGSIFVPLGLICSVIALFSGQAVWGFVGLLLAVAGFLTSPQLWLLLGAGYLYSAFDWMDWIKPFLEMFMDEPPTKET